MYLKHNFVGLDLSGNDLQALIHEAALRNCTLSGLLTHTVERDLRMLQTKRAENPGDELQEYARQKELLPQAYSFLPWISANHRLDEVICHMESIFKTMIHHFFPDGLSNPDNSLVANHIFINVLKDYYSDLDIPAEETELDEYFGGTGEPVKNLESHFTAIRKVYEAYAQEEENPCLLADALLSVLVWWQQLYCGE